MILHCTEKLAAKLKLAPSPAENTCQSPLGSWHANLLRIDRVQCVLFCHDATRFALFLSGLKAPQFAELGRLHRELFLETLASQGTAEALLKRAALALGPLRIDRATDRSVLGSINIAALDVEIHAAHETEHVLELDPVTTSRWLNERPVTARGRLLWPERAMAEVVAQLPYAQNG